MRKNLAVILASMVTLSLVGCGAGVRTYGNGAFRMISFPNTPGYNKGRYSIVEISPYSEFIKHHGSIEITMPDGHRIALSSVTPSLIRKHGKYYPPEDNDLPKTSYYDLSNAYGFKLHDGRITRISTEYYPGDPKRPAFWRPDMSTPFRLPMSASEADQLLGKKGEKGSAPFF